MSLSDGPVGEEVHRRMTPAEHRAADKARLEAAVAAGQLEPTKTYTKYVCPDCGKGSVWTGALGPDRCFDGYSSRFCYGCGAEMVEDGPKDHIIEFEQVSAIEHPELFDWRTERARQDVDRSTIPEEWWHKSRRQDSERSIRSQFEGLHTLIGEGEFIRNVRVTIVPEQPIGVDVTDEWESSAIGSKDGAT